MPQSYLDEMIALAEETPYSFGGIRAAALLHQLYDREYYLEPFAPQEPLTNKSIKIKKSENATPYLSVYPDPAVDLVNLRLSIPEYVFGNTSITIYDLTGKLFSEMKVQRHDQMFTLNTTDWPAGNYRVVVNNNNTMLTHHALVIVK